MFRERVIAVIAVACAAGIAASLSACRSVTRAPVAFVTESYHARDNEEYAFAGWVVGESCEEGFYVPFGGAASGQPMWVRSGDREVPRTVSAALKKALKQKPNAIFLANVTIETETRQGCFEPMRICTIVTGAAMEPSDLTSAKRKPAPSLDDDAPKAPPPPSAPPPTPMTEDAPSRVITPK